MITAKIIGQYSSITRVEFIRIDTDRNLAFIAAEADGVYIMDISDRANPVQLAQYNPSVVGTVKGLWYEYPYLYFGTQIAGTRGLYILDTTDASSPTLKGSVSLARTIERVKKVGNYVYSSHTTGSSYFSIFDVTNPAAPTNQGILTTATTGIVPKGIEVATDGNTAYVPMGTLGLYKIDTTDKAAPSLTGTYNTSVECRDVYLVNGYLVVADRTGGIICLDTDLNLVDSDNPGITCDNLYVDSNNIIYVVGDGGLARYTISDAGVLTLMDGPHVVMTGAQIAVWAEEYIHVSGFTYGSWIILLSESVAKPSWVTRRLNTIEYDTGQNVRLDDGRFVLAPGTYRVRAKVPACGVGSHQAKLVGGDQTLLGTVEHAVTDYIYQSSSEILGVIEVRDGDSFELQHIGKNSRDIIGLGRGMGKSANVYCVVELWKDAQTVATIPDRPLPDGFSPEQRRWLEDLRQDAMYAAGRREEQYAKLLEWKDAGIDGGNYP